MNKENVFNAATELISEFERMYKGWEGVRQFKGTPNRLARMYDELCWDSSRIAEELEKQVKVFKDGFNEMLVTKPIEVWTICPHHLLPCILKVTIGYVPDGSVLGLSKFSRIAEIMGRRPILQEEYSRELADFLEDRLEPKGVAVYIVGKHNCMIARGVKQDVEVITSVIRGVFEKQEVRSEFFSIARS